MKYQISKVVCCVLCACLLISEVFTVYGADTMQEVIFEVPVISNECSDKEVLYFYKYDNTYFLTLDDIVELTRFELLDGDENYIQLTQGARTVSISKETGKLLDCNYIETGSVPIRHIEGQYLIEGIPMLIYLGATCSVTETGELCVMMPWITLWEALMPEYEKYCFDINGLYGGEVSVKISVVCDIVAEILDIGDEKIFPSGKETRYENALHAMLGVDTREYESVQELAALQNKVLNKFLTSTAITSKYQEQFEQQETISKNGMEFWGLAEELFEVSMDYFGEVEREAGVRSWQKAFLKEDKTKMAEVAAENSKIIYTQAAEKAEISKLSTYQDFLEVVMLTADIVNTSNDLINLDIMTRKLLENALNDEMLKQIRDMDFAWLSASKRVTDKLSTDSSIVIETAYEEITKFAVEELVDKGITEILTTLSSNANLYYIATKMSLFIVSVVYDDLFKAYASDLMAIDMNEIHRDVLEILNLVQNKARGECYSNMDTLQQLQKIYILYYRLIISFSEAFAISLEEFGTKNKREWINRFAGREEGSYSNYAAAYLYAITNCAIVPIVDYNSNIDEYFALFEKHDPSLQFSDVEIPKNESISKEDIIVERVETGTNLHCQWFVYGDFNEDGSDEIYAFVCTSATDYSNGQLWYFSESKGYCMFYFGIGEAKLFCNVVKSVPDRAAVELIYFIRNVDEFVEEVKYRYF
ncbi:MAG: hypothetical protein IKW08_03955 [Roseburia sp.]|nr:hypothetical protein [Roseburia sp.]